MGESVRYYLRKISAASHTVATARIAPKICQGQPPTMCSQCSSFHPNPFTFRGLLAERVTRFCPVAYFHDRLSEPI